jgi:uncharacterized cupin superfamily protein
VETVMERRLRLPAIDPMTVPERRGSGYPEPFRRAAGARVKRALGDAAGLTDFGVNLVHLPPGAWSSQRHWHTHEDELVYVLEGELVLITDAGEQVLGPGMAAGFKKNTPDGHHLVNRSDRMAVYLEVGSRHDGEDETFYPDIDLHLGKDRRYRRKSGEPY